MPNPNSKLNIKFNIQLDQDTDEQLEALKSFLKMPKSQTIRHLIRAAFQMHIQHIPTCASCEGCRAPHTFAYSPHLAAPAGPPAKTASIVHGNQDPEGFEGRGVGPTRENLS